MALDIRAGAVCRVADRKQKHRNEVFRQGKLRADGPRG